MQNIITINIETIGTQEVNSVNAREIHNYLEVKTVFAHWIKRAIKKYDFIEDEDYVSFITDVKSGKRDFIVTMDMAKELSMLENNKKGKETRKYFIKMEKEAVAQLQTPSAPTDINAVMFQMIQNQQHQTEAILGLVATCQEQSQVIMDYTQKITNVIEHHATPKVAQQPIYIDGRARRKIHEEIKLKAHEQANELGVSKDTFAPAIWIDLKRFFDVDDYQDLHQSQLKEVLHFIMFWEAKKPKFKSAANEYPFVDDKDVVEI